MNRNYFVNENPTFTVVLPIYWEGGTPSPVLLKTPQAYAESLPKLNSADLFFEEFTFQQWNFGKENFIREEATVTASDGTRQFNQAKYRELKLRYLLVDWSIVGADGVKVPLERVCVDGRPQLSEAAMAKVRDVHSAVMFSAVLVADQVLEGSTPSSFLYTKVDFEALAHGTVPSRLVQPTEQVSPNN